MKSANGIIRNVDELGRIVVPKEMRTKLDIKNGDPVDISIDGDKVIIRKYQTGCMFCGNADVPPRLRAVIMLARIAPRLPKAITSF